jgi:hypothetical protein
MTRVCSACGLEKDENEFRKEKYKKQCISCLSEKSKIYNKIHKNKIKEYSKSYQQGFKRKEYIKLYYQLHKKHLMEKQKKYENERYCKDPLYKLRKTISSSVRKSLKSNFCSKNRKSFFKNVLYTLTDLKQHLESQFESWMTWDNYGKYNSKTWNDNDHSTWTWQVDHIIPHSTFKYISVEDEEFKKCWALSNLRPLSAKQNIIEGTNRKRH